MAGIGVLLLTAGIGRGALAVMGRTGIGAGWFVVFVLGLLCIAVASAYALGRADGAAAEAAIWRRRRTDPARAADLATRSPAAGRPGASLTGVVGNPEPPEPGRRVGDGEPPVATVPEPVGECLRLDELDRFDSIVIASLGQSTRCTRCPHVSATPRGPSWTRDPEGGWCCPHCAGGDS